MTFPRRLLAEQIHMVTRRCSERRFFLKPTEEVKEVVLYALGLALLKCEVEIYALMFEANYYHMVVGDRKSELAEFMRNVDQLVARALNAHYGRGESFWCPGSFSNVEIHDEETLIRKLVYVYSNPVKDWLVARPEEWPGVRTLPEDMGALKLVVKKPKNAFFGGKRPKSWIPRGALTASEIKKREAKNRRDENIARAEGKRPYSSRSKLPEELTVEIGIPLRVVDGAGFVREVRGALELDIAKIHEARRAEGKTRFFGVDAVLATH